MSERSERLFRALSELEEEKIDAAVPEERPRRRWKRWAVLAAALVLAVGIGSQVQPLMRGGGSTGAGAGGGNDSMGTNGSAAFLSYAGPVFPLTLLEEDREITAEREITLELGQWTDRIAQQGIEVTDVSTLTNASQEDKTVSVLYPFAAELLELGKYQPVLTADGQVLETVLHAGPYAGGFTGAGGAGNGGRWNLSGPSSWEEYEALLSDGSYQAAALGEYPDLSGLPATVYRLAAPWVEDGENDTAPSVRVSFQLDFDKTQVLSYGFNSFEQDTEAGWMGLGFFLTQAERTQEQSGAAGYIIVLGEDIRALAVQGGRILDWDEESLPEGGVAIQRYETDLDTALRTVSRVLYDSQSGRCEQNDDWDLSRVDYAMYHGLFCECLTSYGLLSDRPAERYGTGRLEDLDFANVNRIFYLEAQVELPAGEDVTLAAEMTKALSYDDFCAYTENQGLCGCDLVTRLGSSLAFTRQTAVLEGWGEFELVQQNFGFDLEQGITQVELDLDQEHYALQVRRRPGG